VGLVVCALLKRRVTPRFSPLRFDFSGGQRYFLITTEHVFH
jgi:hypothetical protein